MKKERRQRETEQIDNTDEQSIAFSEQEIGKAMIDTPTPQKSDAKKQVERDQQEIEYGEKEDK